MVAAQAAEIGSAVPGASPKGKIGHHVCGPVLHPEKARRPN